MMRARLVSPGVAVATLMVALGVLAGPAAAATVITFEESEGLFDGDVIDTIGGAKFVGATVVFGNPNSFPSIDEQMAFVNNSDQPGKMFVYAVGPLWESVGGFITSVSTIFLRAYDSHDALIGQAQTKGPNTVVDDLPPNEFIEVIAPAGKAIAYVMISDSGNTFTLDNFTYQITSVPTPVPVPAALPLFASALAGLAMVWRRGRGLGGKR
jgi:hypothetical protein